MQGIVYKFRVQSLNTIGTSDYSPVLSILTAIAPAAPINPQTVNYATSVNITFTDPSQNH
jgi:hypothetical protein